MMLLGDDVVLVCDLCEQQGTAKVLGTAGLDLLSRDKIWDTGGSCLLMGQPHRLAGLITS